MKSKLLAALSAFAVFTFVGCDPVPRHTLNDEEKAADLLWMYSQFGQNYAPLEYKQKLHGFDYETKKQEYLAASKLTTTNDEFFALMFQFVAEFKDAHTSASLTNSSLPNRAQVAYLGFSGVRQGSELLVKNRLPTIADDSAYPIKKGDLIVAWDGKALPDAIRSELRMYRDLGHDEATITYHMNKLFTRVSTSNGLPALPNAVLTVKRDGKTFDVTLPWVLKDLYQFQAEQEDAKKEKKSEEAARDQIAMAGADGQILFRFNFIGFDGRLELPRLAYEKIARRTRARFEDGFRLIDAFADWAIADPKAAEKTPRELLAEQRPVPGKAVIIDDAKTFPAYVSREKTYSRDGKESGRQKLVGYIYLDTFSPEGKEADVLKEFGKTLLAMQTLGVEDLVIDTINNGGGSLSLGLKMAQMLSPKAIEMPKIQFRLSDTWLDQFETESMAASGSDNATREISRRMLDEMVADQKRGQLLSQRYSIDQMYPFAFSPNAELNQPFKVVLLVNEMCASMCDIFAAALQDNGMATVVGSRSMGAGGNVVDHNQAPNSHLDLRQTESLIIRKDGSYIENVGVNPDVVLSVHESAGDKYRAALSEGLKALLTEP